MLLSVMEIAVENLGLKPYFYSLFVIFTEASLNL